MAFTNLEKYVYYKKCLKQRRQPPHPHSSLHQSRGYFRAEEVCTAPEMIPTPKWSPTLKWSPNRPRNDPHFSLRRPPKWSPINSWNGMVFRHGIITSVLHRLRSWIAFNISLQFMWLFSYRYCHLIAFMSTFAHSTSFSNLKQVRRHLFKIQYPRHAVLTSFLEFSYSKNEDVKTSMQFSL